MFLLTAVLAGMSLHMSLIAIEGNRLSALPAIFRAAGYKVEGEPKKATCNTVVDLLESPTANIDTVRKAAYFSKGWTYIVDEEMVLFVLADKEWKKLSRSPHSKVVAWICEGTSGTCGITVYDHGMEVRTVISVAGKVEGKGLRLREEGQTDWANVSQAEVLEIAEKLGASYGQLKENVSYYVYTLTSIPRSP